MEVFLCVKMGSMNTDITTYLISKGITDPTSLKAVSRQFAANGLSAQAENIDSALSDAGFKKLLDIETAKLSATGLTSDQAGELADKVNELTDKDTSISRELTDLGEMRRLISSLDKSIFGQVAESLDEEEVAADLLADPAGARKVIDQLVSGHVNSIVMTHSDESDDTEDALKSEVSDSLSETSTETLAQNLETLMEHLNQLGE